MKHSFVILFVVAVVSGCSIQQPTLRVSENRLYTSDDIDQIKNNPPAKAKKDNAYFDEFLPFGKPVSALESQITTALRSRKKSTPLVLYVHGRGDHMEKTVDKRIVGNLEDNYGIAVIQFHWQSQRIKGFNSYPIKQAVDSAPNLISVLQQLENIRRNPNGILAGRKVHMLVHSMGNLMIREIGSVPFVQPENVIDNLILNAPDVPRKDAESWLKAIKFSKKTTVVHYKKDSTLWVSKWLFTGGVPKLGLDYQPVSGIEDYYAEANGFSHRHFGSDNINKSDKLKGWFKSMLN